MKILNLVTLLRWGDDYLQLVMAKNKLENMFDNNR